MWGQRVSLMFVFLVFSFYMQSLQKHTTVWEVAAQVRLQLENIAFCILGVVCLIKMCSDMLCLRNLTAVDFKERNLLEKQRYEIIFLISMLDRCVLIWKCVKLSRNKEKKRSMWVKMYPKRLSRLACKLCFNYTHFSIWTDKSLFRTIF